MLNDKLAVKQGLDETTREVINKLHLLREFIEDYKTTNPKKIKFLYKEWYENELLLQKLWKFKVDENYIRFWEFPYCTCPKMDNEDRYPTGHYIVHGDCPVHGEEAKKIASNSAKKEL